MGKMTAGVANPQADLRSSRRRHSIQQVADQFLHQYYTVFCHFPKYLHRFYKNKSTITISESLDNGEMIFETASGQEDDIKKKVVPLFPDARIKLDNYSPQFSMDEGILLLVTGRLCRKGMPDCEFAQSFYLAVQAKGFFVLNDIIRIMPSRKSVMDAGTQTDSAKTEVDVPSKLPSPPTITHLPHAVQPAAPKKVDAIASGQTQLQPPPPLSDTKKPKPRKLMSADASCDGSGGSPRSQQPPTPTAADVTPGSKAVGHGHERQPSPRRESNKPRKTSESQHQRHGQQQQQQQQPPSPQQPPIGGPRSARNGSSSPSSSPTTPRQTPRLTSPTLLSAQRARSVFVRSLPEAADEAALMEAFGTDGQVAEGGITIKQGRRDRFAFVELTSVEAVDAVLAREVRVMGKPVQVEEKRPMVIRRPGKGGGNGGGGVRRSFSGNMVRQTSGSPPGYISSVSGPRSFHQSSMANPAYA